MMEPKLTRSQKVSTVDLAASPTAFIQWKGTDVCLDFYCPCGMQSHFDGDFAYALECAACHRIFDMPSHIQPTERRPDGLEEWRP